MSSNMVTKPETETETETEQTEGKTVELRKVLRTALWVKSHALGKDLTSVAEQIREESKSSSQNSPAQSSSEMSEEAEEILRKRRERNRLAAQRCREKRRSRIEGLEKVVDNLEQEGTKIENEISSLEEQKQLLEALLNGHSCVFNYSKDISFQQSLDECC